MSVPEDLIKNVTASVEEYMSKYDSSHDFSHIRRVVGLSHEIYTDIAASNASQDTPTYDKGIITLSALLHDVGDRKYLKPGQDEKTLVYNLLRNLGAPEVLASKIQTIVLGVSYSSEILDEQHVKDLIEKHPELGVVQDADRLDAIGAVGIGRVFAYGAAKTTRDMHDSMGMMDRKLLLIEGMMKTKPGRRMAEEKTRRLRVFQEWWDEEVKDEKVGADVLGWVQKDVVLN